MICLGDTWENKILIHWLTACAWHGGIVGWLMDTIFSSSSASFQIHSLEFEHAAIFFCCLLCFYYPPALFSGSRKEVRALRCSSLFFLSYFTSLCKPSRYDRPLHCRICSGSGWNHRDFCWVEVLGGLSFATLGYQPTWRQ